MAGQFLRLFPLACVVIVEKKVVSRMWVYAHLSFLSTLTRGHCALLRIFIRRWFSSRV
jgi:hypothetical protein